jgi:hypothetical protein
MSLKGRQKKVPMGSASEPLYKDSPIWPWDAVFVVQWPHRRAKMNVQELVLNKLSREQIQEELNCLYHELEPQDQMLRDLEPQEWAFLVALLDGLMRERKVYNLH